MVISNEERQTAQFVTNILQNYCHEGNALKDISFIHEGDNKEYIYDRIINNSVDCIHVILKPKS